MAYRLILLAALCGCATRVPGRVEIVRPGENALAYDYHDATLHRAEDGLWWVTLIRYDRSGGPQIRAYDNERVETLEIPVASALRDGATFAPGAQTPIRFWHAPMARGTARRFAGEVVVESWDPERRRVRGRFETSGGDTRLAGTFDAYLTPLEK